MSDRITSLCTRLLETEEPAEIRPVADDLRYAIHEHIDKVREMACEILLIDRVVNGALRIFIGDCNPTFFDRADPTPTYEAFATDVAHSAMLCVVPRSVHRVCRVFRPYS